MPQAHSKPGTADQADGLGVVVDDDGLVVAVVMDTQDNKLKWAQLLQGDDEYNAHQHEQIVAAVVAAAAVVVAVVAAVVVAAVVVDPVVIAIHTLNQNPESVVNEHEHWDRGH